MPAHSSASGTDLHEAKRQKEPARAASTANVSTSSPGASLDGVTLTAGDRILLKDQSTASQNGIYIWAAAASALTRAADADSAADFAYGFLTYVREGTVNGAKYFVFTTSAAVTLGSTSLTFSGVSSSGTLIDPTTTRGDLIVRDASNVIAALPVGSNGAVLWSNAADPQWRTNPTLTTSVSAPLFSVNTASAGGHLINFTSLTELLTIAAAATSTTTIQIPAAAILLAVVVRVTVVIPTAATFTVIGNTSTTVYNTAAVSTAANTTDPGTAAGAVYNAAAQTIRITPNLTPANNTGRVRVGIFYMTATPPTS